MFIILTTTMALDPEECWVEHWLSGVRRLQVALSGVELDPEEDFLEKEVLNRNKRRGLNDLHIQLLVVAHQVTVPIHLPIQAATIHHHILVAMVITRTIPIVPVPEGF